MQRFLIVTINGALLILLLIGLPTATREQVGNLQFSHADTGRTLLFCGLGLALVLNLLCAFKLKGKNKLICWEWAAIYALLLLAAYGLIRGWVQFEWLRKTLQWLQDHL